MIFSFAFVKPAPKVDVCHLDKDSGVFFLINISENALKAHLIHGDGLPGEAVQGKPGWAFDADCTPYKLEIAEPFVNGKTGAVVSTEFNTKPGIEYKLVATGMYKFENWATVSDPDLGYADAKYSKRTAANNPYGTGNAWVDGADLTTKYALQVSLWDGNTTSPLTPVVWEEAYYDAHKYSAFVTGDGKPISLFIYDNAYSDNQGGITVNITEQLP